MNSSASDPEIGKPPISNFRDQLLQVCLAVFTLWSVKIVEEFSHQSFSSWGLFPRSARGLLGIFTMPFLHADLDHLWANSFGLLALGLLLLNFYPKVALRVVLFSWFFSGLLVWIFARPSYHIGASAVIYGLAAFLFTSGLIRRDRPSIGPLLIVSFLFGASLWGVLPLQTGISWEGHLFGGLTGITLALVYRNVDRPQAPTQAPLEPEPWSYNPYREDGERHGWK